ncbi:hypothetical protein SDC9_75419 [bioreactor metagenome]|uniref:Uncharacterized protein n=1 Tax=bioreactor metagenome TaxID=1076179 RepID=A0A644YJR5_9ZZZZ
MIILVYALNASENFSLSAIVTEPFSAATIPLIFLEPITAPSPPRPLYLFGFFSLSMVAIPAE